MGAVKNIIVVILLKQSLKSHVTMVFEGVYLSTVPAEKFSKVRNPDTAENCKIAFCYNVI